jgi:hypothetical protein
MPYIEVPMVRCQICGIFTPEMNTLACTKCGRQACLSHLKRHLSYGPYCVDCFQQLLPLQQKILQDAEDELRKTRKIAITVLPVCICLLIPMGGIPVWTAGIPGALMPLEIFVLVSMCALCGGFIKIAKKLNPRPQQFQSPPPPLPLE